MPLFAPVAVPLVNGVGWSFAHISLVIANMSFTGGFKSIKYSRKRSRELARSNSPDPIFKTLGENEYQASAEMYVEWWAQVIKQIEDTLGVGYGDQFFDVHVSYAASGFTPRTDTILGCTFDSSEADNSQGPGALTRMVELAPMKILFDGRDDLANPLAPVGS